MTEYSFIFLFIYYFCFTDYLLDAEVQPVKRLRDQPELNSLELPLQLLES